MSNGLSQLQALAHSSTVGGDGPMGHRVESYFFESMLGTLKGFGAAVTLEPQQVADPIFARYSGRESFFLRHQSKIGGDTGIREWILVEDSHYA